MNKKKPLLKKSLYRGFKGYCPNCGTGKIFYSFLKVASNCPYCNEELYHHRADDMPAYITVTLVGHIIVPLILYVVKNFDIEDWIHYIMWMPLSVILSLILIERVKGSIVALQWSLNMHGFGDSK